jgi:hypothetical protein
MVIIIMTRYELEDCFTTAIQHYRRYQISRFFSTMQLFMEKKKSEEKFSQFTSELQSRSQFDPLKIPMVDVSPISKPPQTLCGPTGTPILSPIRPVRNTVNKNCS